MALQLQVSDEVLDRLGGPTVEGLRSRLTEHAPCLGCGELLGSGPVSVIGQQYVLVIGAHAACRPSEWILFEQAQELQVPLTAHATGVFAL
jgi:hypothetical protein